MNSQVTTAAGKLKRIREAYIKQLPAQLGVIRKAYNDAVQDSCGLAGMEILHRSIHTLKGACASFGLKKLSTVAASGELLAKNVMNPEASADRIWHQKIQECLTSLEAEIKNIDTSQYFDTRAVELVAASEVTSGRDQKVIYICEDDSYQRLSLATQIECFGFNVTSFGELDQLSNAVQNSAPDAIVMDMIFPDRPTGGAEIIETIILGGINQ